MPDSLQDFIKATWGDDDVARIARVRTGGDNNDKGGRYEALFTTYLIAKHALEDRGRDVQVSAQELAWVDDVCVRIGGKRKINYQAKNSAGDAANWDPEISARFAKQQVIDTDHHRFDEAQQVLLVSCENKHLKNKGKIEDEMADFASCEFYPFAEPATHILFYHQPTIQVFSGLCAEPSLDDMQTAMKAIMAQWANQPAATPIGVCDLIQAAKEEARPNVFKELDEPEKPGWLVDLIAPFPSASIKVQSGDFMVSIKGLTVRLPGALAEGDAPEYDGEVGGEQELITLLFWLSSQAQL